MVTKPSVLVVEDEPSIAELIAVNLRHSGFEVTAVHECVAAQHLIDKALPDLLLLDWMLPGQSGESLTRRLRANDRTKELPIVLLTARGDEADKVAGLNAGADDYVTKPFSTQELIARLRAVLRRRKPASSSTTLQVGALILDTSAHQAIHAGIPLKLGPTEYKLLTYFMQHAGRVHSRAHLLDAVWGNQVSIEERTVDVHIKRLREGLGEGSPLLETVRGAGYRLIISD